MSGENAQGTGAPQQAATAANANGNGRVAGQARAAGQATRGVARGLGGFLKPFRTVGGKIWLEVTGAFFLLPVLVFAPVMWRTRASWLQGPDHRTFLSAAVIIAVFLYLGVSSFWRAGRRR
jgi:hypothetical protein